MTKDDVVKAIKQLAYNNKDLTEAALIERLEQIILETKMDALNQCVEKVASVFVKISNDLIDAFRYIAQEDDLFITLLSQDDKEGGVLEEFYRIIKKE